MFARGVAAIAGTRPAPAAAPADGEQIWRLWRDFPYEYETERLAIDAINGGPSLREWVDDPAATPNNLDALSHLYEDSWLDERRAYLRD